MTTTSEFKAKHGHEPSGCCLLGFCGFDARKDAWEITRAESQAPCSSCGDPVGESGSNGVCFTCRQLENNRRYRLHHSLGEYAPEKSEGNHPGMEVRVA